MGGEGIVSLSFSLFNSTNKLLWIQTLVSVIKGTISEWNLSFSQVMKTWVLIYTKSGENSSRCRAMQPSQIFKNGGFQSCIFECLFLKTTFSDGFFQLLIDYWDCSAWHCFIVAIFAGLSFCRWHQYPCYMGHFSSTLRAKYENEKKRKRKFVVQGPCSFKCSAYQ